MKEKEITLKFGVDEIVVIVSEKGGGKISSNLHAPEDGSDCSDCDDPETWNNYADALESIILGHACAGVDISSPEYHEGIQTALDACGNRI